MISQYGTFSITPVRFNQNPSLIVNMTKSSFFWRMIAKGREGEGSGLFLLNSTKTAAGPSIEGFLYFPSKRHAKVRGGDRFFFS